jgi:hypothetical protein
VCWRPGSGDRSLVAWKVEQYVGAGDGGPADAERSVISVEILRSVLDGSIIDFWWLGWSIMMRCPNEQEFVDGEKDMGPALLKKRLGIYNRNLYVEAKGKNQRKKIPRRLERETQPLPLSVVCSYYPPIASCRSSRANKEAQHQHHILFHNATQARDALPTIFQRSSSMSDVAIDSSFLV